MRLDINTNHQAEKRPASPRLVLFRGLIDRKKCYAVYTATCNRYKPRNKDAVFFATTPLGHRGTVGDYKVIRYDFVGLRLEEVSGFGLLAGLSAPLPVLAALPSLLPFDSAAT